MLACGAPLKKRNAKRVAVFELPIYMTQPRRTSNHPRDTDHNNRESKLGHDSPQSPLAQPLSCESSLDREKTRRDLISYI